MLKNKKRIRRASALLMVLALLMVNVSTGADDSNPDAPGVIYSDWLSLNGLRTTGATSSDLADFLDSVVITGAELNEQGQYVILQGVPYTIQMNFSEKTGGLQFGANPLVYHFPDGFSPNPTPTPGTVEMDSEGGVVRLNYVISGDTLTVTIDETSPGYSSYEISESVQFEIHATGVIDQEQIQFTQDVIGYFDLDETREVSVQKIGTYDPVLNKVKFTIQASSKGKNTDIHIGDIVRGTALINVPSQLTVTSNLNNPVQYNNDTRQGETFGITLPFMSHGEIVTIEYYADVNLDYLASIGSGNYGTIEATGNSVSIFSHEDPPGDNIIIDNDDFENTISLSTNSKTASSLTERNGKTYVTWTIVLNENANISIAGDTVTDTIDASCQQIMRYSGTGIHIQKYLKDGTLAGTSDIGWGTNGLTAGYGGSTWTYTIPQTDGAYRYVITYETEVDTDTLLRPTTVINDVHNTYDDDHGATIIEPTGERVDAVKTTGESVVDTVRKTAETEWVIEFTVPSTGLTSAVIDDSLPAFLNSEQNRWYYDTYLEDSISVENLLDGEEPLVDLESTPNHVIITFTKNNGQPGLTGTGLSRTIRVHLTTVADPAWLVYAESVTRARTHENHAIVWANDQDIHVSSTVSYNTTQYDLRKVQTGIYSTNTNPELPIYVYKIILTGVNDGAFDEDGYITITDEYDADYLAFYPTYSTSDTYNVNRPNGHVFGNTQWDTEFTLMDMYKGPYVVDHTSEGQIVFKISKADLEECGTAYFPYYTIAYALQIKNAPTLDRIKNEALHSNGMKVELKNTAYNGQFGTNTIVTDYTIRVLDKELLYEEDNGSTGTHDLHFKLKVNPEGLKIGDGNTITVRDTLTNLSFDYTSIVVSPQLNGDILNRTGSSVIFTLHNETPYTITYTVRLVGLHNVQWNNRAELFGYVTGLNGTSSSQSGGSGTVPTYSMNVKKYAEGNMNQGLAATFEIYEAQTKDANGNDISNPTWVPVDTFTTDGTTGLYQIRTVQGHSLRRYSHHDSNGVELFGVDYGWRYRIIETVEPPGYQKKTTVYEFGISDIPSYAAPYNYLNNDTVTIVNTPVAQPVSVRIPGKKVLVGKELENLEFAFTLTPESSIKEAWGDGDYPGGFGESQSVRNDRNGDFIFPLTFTYDDYVNAEQKGFVGTDHAAYFYYVISEELPEESENNIWNGVVYDDSKFLVVVKLFLDGSQLRTQATYYPYDGEVPEGLQIKKSPRRPQTFLSKANQ